jgi:formylglycine-generating enzyme required for sulfatase activity
MKKQWIMIATALLTAGIAQAAFITIRTPGNAADTATGFGSVGYTYRISDHEVSIAEFAKSVACNGDEDYWNDDSTTGSGRTVGINAPASNFSLYDAMKYCNWLTTGDVDSGYYSTRDGGETYQANVLSHDVYAAAHGITYFVPTEDEWYKVAYWTGSGYSLYANGTSTTPTEGGGASGWNYNDVNLVLAPNRVRSTALGTTEQNGTVNMMGNVGEWTEDSVVMGFSYYQNKFYLRSTFSHFAYDSSHDDPSIGFRPVVVIPTFITIGNAGNENDTATGYGGVAYEYRISAHEVTIAEFTASDAGDGDEGYWNDGTRTVGTDAPAVYVSLYEAMKYCNWLTTGDVDSGYYSTTNSGVTYQANALAHDVYAEAHGTTYFISTEDEWYKAAYYDASGTNGYSLYADGTSDIYNQPTKGGDETGWNYGDVTISPNYTRNASFGTTEQNETVNMMGNVWDRTEESVIRGGDCYEDYETKLRSTYRSIYTPANEHDRIGFRPVVVICEPTVFVTIGNAGNAADTANGGIYGDVAYEYKISDREVTITEMAASGAGDADEGLWNDGSYNVGPNAPASNVSLYEAMKYCNWLTTGDVDSGYYSNSGGGVYVTNALSHYAYATAHGTTYFVPTEDEWYKAAYYDASGSNGYSLYADGNSDTGNPPSEGGGATGWNYNFVNLSPDYTRGAASGTTEQNGTVNMMGNLHEWVEDSAGAFRGGMYGSDETYLRSSYRQGYLPSNENHGVGFRPIVVESTFVSIGDVGNADDTVGVGYGGVAYEYKISDHEVTIAEFAESGAGDGNEDYWNDPSEGNNVGPNAPATKVSLYEAMKYCNWLTTGDVTSGYYSNSGGGVYVTNALSHDAYAAAHGITFFIPTEDEWYKAAYWTGSDYSDYANGTGTFPTEGGEETGWNYNNVNLPNYVRRTTLGTTEQNGTVNMMGNVAEWIEYSTGRVRGGGFASGYNSLRSANSTSTSQLSENNDKGFRPVVVVPEPTTFVTIGDARNNDDSTGYGGVDYEYKISDREVTIAEFAESGAGSGNEDYWNNAGEGNNVGPNAPAVYISIYEAMKYCNWLTTGYTNRGYYSTSDDGATYQANVLAHDVYAEANGTTYFVPTEDEWYKAAYWTGNDYSDYANGDNLADGTPTEGGEATGWNYNSVNYPNYARGSALGTIEQNETVNMMGNVWEWIENSSGVARGGGYHSFAYNLKSENRADPISPSDELDNVGFRPVVVSPSPVEYVEIGDPSNSADGAYGAVNYTYKISNREVMIEEFAASGAGDGDENAWNTLGRTVGSAAPAVNVSLYEAMKYCNWLTTGDVDSGYYSNSGEGVYVGNSMTHDAYATIYGTTYFVPTEDEWYKAAYWTGSGYSLYANGTGTIPTEGGGTTGWNYSYVNLSASPNFTRGAALGTIEQNGTVNMMGNVWEWMEDSSGKIRGGTYISEETSLRSSYQYDGYSPFDENAGVGFRPVVVNPEPATFVTIGNAGNEEDTSDGDSDTAGVQRYGGVPYQYKICDREVTIAEFALSNAGDGDEDYWNDGRCTVGPNAPAVYVSLYEAMKYCNWLTTGDINSGYYSNDGEGVYQANVLSHDAYAEAHGTTYFVPTENEWYKAAYYDASGVNGYSLYADGTSDINNPPTKGGETTGWNYDYAKYDPNFTRATAFGTTEQNGTVNMMGNVWERTEESVIRGGGYSDGYFMRSSERLSSDPTIESYSTGFRPVVVESTFVIIGDAGNADNTFGNGGVSYEYLISAQEVSIAQMAASGAGDGDEDYWNDASKGTSVGSGAPATRVSLYEAMKYCNWLTTGDVTSGYYSTSDGVVYVKNSLSHDAYAAAHGTTYFVPTSDEWIKAAYWTGNGYSLYADGTSNTNYPPAEGGGTTGWNYNDVNLSPNYTRDVYLGTIEQNGTVNMMGNVKELMEKSTGTCRGGDFNDSEFVLRSSVIGGTDPAGESWTDGFRPVKVVSTFVTIGNAGNAADPANDGIYGGVDYEYKISDQEVSIAKFAASGAGDGDEGYWNDDSTTESGRTVGTDAPAVYVSLYEAMKYCNWLTTGDVNSGYYSTTNSGVTYQANALAHDVYAVANGTTYFVPTEDEWYKAAYWTGSDYSDYANGDDVADGPPTEGGHATGWNYNYRSTARGADLGTVEQNGTVNMMGNLWEWMEDSEGKIRGGSLYDEEDRLRSSTRFVNPPSGEVYDLGFRPVVIVSVSSSATAPSLVMSGLDFSWQGETGQSYSVMTTTNMLTVQWAPVPGWPQSGTGEILSYINTYTNRQRYFKVSVGSQ